MHNWGFNLIFCFIAGGLLGLFTAGFVTCFSPKTIVPLIATFVITFSICMIIAIIKSIIGDVMTLVPYQDTEIDWSYADRMLARLGYDQLPTAVTKNRAVKLVHYNVRLLLMYVFDIEQTYRADQIIENYQSLMPIAHALYLAYDAKNADNETTKKLIDKYVANLKQLEKDLYKLVEPNLNRLPYEIIKAGDYDLLPKEQYQKLVQKQNERLLDGLD